MAKCVPTCGMCAKYGTQRCPLMAQMKVFEQIVQGAYPWHCLYRKIDEEQEWRQDPDLSHGRVGGNIIDVLQDRYRAQMVELAHVKGGHSCPKCGCELDKSKLHNKFCPMVGESDKDGSETGSFCECAIRKIKYVENAYNPGEWIDVPVYEVHCSTCDWLNGGFELSEDWQSKFEKCNVDYLQHVSGASSHLLKYCETHNILTMGDLIMKFNVDDYVAYMHSKKFKEKTINNALKFLTLKDGLLLYYINWKDYVRSGFNYLPALHFNGKTFELAEPDVDYMLEVVRKIQERNREEARAKRDAKQKRHQEALARRREKDRAKREAAREQERIRQEKLKAKEELVNNTINTILSGRIMFSNKRIELGDHIGDHFFCLPANSLFKAFNKRDVERRDEVLHLCDVRTLSVSNIWGRHAERYVMDLNLLRKYLMELDGEMPFREADSKEQHLFHAYDGLR